jgi:FkbM family methyltransferase
MAKRMNGFPLRRKMLGWVKRGGYAPLGGPSVRVQISDTLAMDVDPSDERGWALFVDRALQPRAADAFKALLRKGDTVIDVGANHGYFTLLGSSIVGHAGRVHSFEPDPPIAKLLFENVRLNNCQNVTLHHAAVSNAEGIKEYRISARPGSPAASAQVPVVVVDKIAEEMPKSRLVRVDVAGAELAALEGMKDLLGYDRPFALVHAISPASGASHVAAENASSIIALFRSLGYSTHEITATGSRSIDRPTPELAWLLAVPPGAHPPSLAVAM